MLTNKIGKLWPNTKINNFETINCHEQHISNIYCDRDFLLSDDKEAHLNTNNYQTCPEITIKICNLPIVALIDSGANITCISEEWYQQNRENMLNYEELPVTNVHIKTALGTQSKRISRTLLIPTQIAGQESLIQCIVVPNLLKQMIIGTDVMGLLEMVIDFKQNMLIMNINDKHINLKFDEVNKNGILCYIYNNAKHNKPNVNDEYKNYYEDMTDTDNQINEEVNGNSILNTEQKVQLRNVMKEYSYIFTDTPGRCNKYTHEIKVNNPESYRTQNYPVPMTYQDAVAEEIERMLNLHIIERSTTSPP